MANLLLGVPDEWIPAGYKTRWDVNKVGGSPDWMSLPPPQTSCTLCGERQVFLAQLYCPLEDQPYHRTLYVFACTTPKCRGNSQSWTVLRGQQLDPTFNAQGAPQTAGGKTAGDGDSWGVTGGGDSWGMDADDWGDDDDDGDQNEDFPALENNAVSSPTTVGPICDAAETRSATGLTEPMRQDVWNGSKTWTTNKLETDANGRVPSRAESLTLDEAADNLEAMSIEDGTSQAMSTEDGVISDDVGVRPDESVLCQILQPSHSDVKVNPRVEIPGLFLAVIEEPKETQSCAYEKKLYKEYLQTGGIDVEKPKEEAHMSSKKGKGKGKGGGGSSGDGVYEKAVATHGDKVFAKFSKTISSCPQQILRYCLGGDALHISAAQHTPVPACSSCGSARMYECQLMSAMVPLLKPLGSEEPAVEFGTVLVYTCSRSCWDDKGYRTEYAVIEDDVLQPMKRQFNL